MLNDFPATEINFVLLTSRFVIREQSNGEELLEITSIRIFVDAGNWWIRARQIGSTIIWSVSIALFIVFSFSSKPCDVQMKASMKQKV